jgi:hypothetical protein
MAMTLKASGLATDLTSCVAVDDDDTIKDFVGATISLDTDVAASVSTAATWAGVTRRHFVTTSNTEFDFRGVRFSATRPVIDEDAGVTIWFACAGASAAGTPADPSAFVTIGGGGTGPRGVARVPSGTALTYRNTGSPMAQTSTGLPTDNSTKFSAGITYRNATSSTASYGVDGGTLTVQDTEGSDGGFGFATTLWHIGGAAGYGNQPFRPFIVCTFDRILSEAEQQTLHNDWFNTLFDGEEEPPALMGQACL